MTTSRATQLLVSQGLSPEAARQRVARRSHEIATLRGLPFPKRARFIYLEWQYRTELYWSALNDAIREANPAYSAALAGIRARGGMCLRKHFDIICGSPLKQKRQLSSEVILDNLLTVGLLDGNEIDEVGFISIASPTGFRFSQAKVLKARLMTEAVLLNAIRSWAGRMNMASPNVTRIRDDDIDPQFLTFRFDLSGPSYLQPQVKFQELKAKPGFFVADVLLGAELDETTVSPFIRKCGMLAIFRNARPFLPMLIADGFTPDALKLCRSKGIIATRPDTLFGQDVAQALKDLFETLTRTASGTAERIERLFNKLSTVEGAAGNLRGALFELVVGHCVREIEGGQPIFGSIVTDRRNGNRAEIDVLLEKQRQLTVYECKGYQPESRVNHAEIEHWLTDRVPTIHAALKDEPRYQNAKIAFEFWTSASFDEQSLALLAKAKQNTRRYRIDWKSGVEIREYAKALVSPGISRILDEHYFKHPLAESDFRSRSRKLAPPTGLNVI